MRELGARCCDNGLLMWRAAGGGAEGVGRSGPVGSCRQPRPVYCIATGGRRRDRPGWGTAGLRVGQARCSVRLL